LSYNCKSCAKEYREANKERKKEYNKNRKKECRHEYQRNKRQTDSLYKNEEDT
jgi:hypothetical protein